MDILTDLKQAGDPVKAAFFPRFFKTGKGQYGYGDIFWGVTVPKQRIIAKKYIHLSLKEIATLLASPIHECRLTALLILVSQFQKGDEQSRKKIFDFYFKHSKKINNWDLVDSSADKIVGEYLLDKDTSPLNKLARSENLWQRRIAIIATYAFIKNNRFDKTLQISTLLINDNHDLIHKAVGWMLREIGKRDEKVLITFLEKHSSFMPRTMLRYATEKLDVNTRIQIYNLGG